MTAFTIPPPKWIPQIDKPDSNRKAKRFEKFRLKHRKRGFTKVIKNEMCCDWNWKYRM